MLTLNTDNLSFKLRWNNVIVDYADDVSTLHVNGAVLETRTLTNHECDSPSYVYCTIYNNM